MAFYSGKGLSLLKFIRAFLILIVLCTIVMVLLGSFQSYPPEVDLPICFIDIRKSTNIRNDKAQRFDDLLAADVKPKLDKLNIFFIVSTCSHMPPEATRDVANLLELSARQACALESAALHNPNTDVFALFVKPTYMIADKTPSVVNALLTYPNIHLRNVDLPSYTKGSPMEDFLRNGTLFKSHFLIEHISDFLRYLTLWRFGGLYLDTDVIVLRNMEALEPNYAGSESDWYIASSIMNMARSGSGHEIALRCLQEFRCSYQYNNWAHNGPGVITRVMQDVCGSKNMTEMMDRHRCMGFQVYPREEFFEIPYSEWKQFFNETFTENTLKRLSNKPATHLWNKFSKVWEIKVGANAAFGRLAERHCPKVNAAAGDKI